MTKTALPIEPSPSRADSDKDVLAYRKARDAERRAALDAMVAENQRLGLYDD